VTTSLQFPAAGESIPCRAMFFSTSRSGSR